MLNLGIAGEFRAVVTRADGSVKTDTGFVRNLVLNQGLEFFGGSKGGYFNSKCLIGSGNSSPAITQISLDTAIAIQSTAPSPENANEYAFNDSGDGLYRIWEQRAYRFTGLSDVNISEVGLASEGTLTDYYLTTRALIKDALGNPTTISIKAGETLEIVYRIHKVIDINDKSFVVDVKDGAGGSVPYNVVVRPARIGTTTHNVAAAISTVAGGRFAYSTADLGAKEGYPTGGSVEEGVFSLATYTPLTNKRTGLLSFGLTVANVAIRTVFTSSPSYFSFFPFQMRFGRVSDDAPLTKTNKDTLSIPFEISWGRYEGEL